MENIINNGKELWADLENVNKWHDLKKIHHRRSFANAACISLTKHSGIIFKSGFVKQLNLKENNYNYVTIHFSESLRAVVFSFNSIADDLGCYTLRINNSGTATVTARNFFTEYNITEIGNHKAHLEKIPGHGKCWVIYLDQQEK